MMSLFMRKISQKALHEALNILLAIRNNLLLIVMCPVARV